MDEFNFKPETKKNYEKLYTRGAIIILCVIVLFLIFMNTSKYSNLDNICSIENATLQRVNGTWTCGRTTTVSNQYYVGSSTSQPMNFSEVNTNKSMYWGNRLNESDLNHNALNNLQGGLSGQYYHLNALQLSNSLNFSINQTNDTLNYINSTYYDKNQSDSIFLTSATANQTYVKNRGAVTSVDLNGKNLTNVTLMNITDFYISKNNMRFYTDTSRRLFISSINNPIISATDDSVFYNSLEFRQQGSDMNLFMSDGNDGLYVFGAPSRDAVDSGGIWNYSRIYADQISLDQLDSDLRTLKSWLIRSGKYSFPNLVITGNTNGIIVLNSTVNITGNLILKNNSICNATACFTLQDLNATGGGSSDFTNVAYVNNSQSFLGVNQFVGKVCIGINCLSNNVANHALVINDSRGLIIYGNGTNGGANKLLRLSNVNGTTGGATSIAEMYFGGFGGAGRPVIGVTRVDGASRDMLEFRGGSSYEIFINADGTTWYNDRYIKMIAPNQPNGNGGTVTMMGITTSGVAVIGPSYRTLSSDGRSYPTQIYFGQRNNATAGYLDISMAIPSGAVVSRARFDNVSTFTVYGDLNITKKIINGNASAWANWNLCYMSDGSHGHNNATACALSGTDCNCVAN